MFKFTDEQKAYIYEKMDEQIKNSELQNETMKNQFARIKENIDNLSTADLCVVLTMLAMCSLKDDCKPNALFWGGFNGGGSNTPLS